MNCIYIIICCVYKLVLYIECSVATLSSNLYTNPQTCTRILKCVHESSNLYRNPQICTSSLFHSPSRSCSPIRSDSPSPSSSSSRAPPPIHVHIKSLSLFCSRPRPRPHSRSRKALSLYMPQSAFVGLSLDLVLAFAVLSLFLSLSPGVPQWVDVKCSCVGFTTVHLLTVRPCGFSVCAPQRAHVQWGTPSCGFSIFSVTVKSCGFSVCALYIRSREVGGWGRDPKKCTGRDWGMGSSTI